MMPSPGVVIGSLFAVVFAACASGLFGSWIATQKGRRENEGFVLGAILGPLGWLIELLLPNITKPQR